MLQILNECYVGLEDKMARLAYVATIQVTIHPNEKVETFAEACDWVSGLFSEQLENSGKIVDCNYLKVGYKY